SVVVFDCEEKKVVTSINLSKACPNMPQMGFWTFLDKCQMLVTGKYAHVAWVDNSAEQAQLQLISFDLTVENTKAVEQTIPLNFNAKKSVLHDLIAADGRLYALVTESEHLWIRDPRWTRQHVIAIGQ
ncbi:MAG: hypothetical protein HRU15_16605, partial [Planctomycetes bacterium]|nr:hypothetical protein [Planctomycetota bacterium]